MDADELLQLGHYCDVLIADPSFQQLSASFEGGLVSDMLATKPDQTKLREHIYAKVCAHREFITFLVELIKLKNEALKPIEPEEDNLDPNGFDYTEETAS